MAHTDGPWEVTRSTFRMAGEADRVNRITIAAPGRRVAQIDGPFVSTRDEVEANARLIASAPELLHALELIANVSIGGDNEAKIRDIWAFANAAIAKARPAAEVQS